MESKILNSEEAQEQEDNIFIYGQAKLKRYESQEDAELDLEGESEEDNQLDEDILSTVMPISCFNPVNRRKKDSLVTRPAFSCPFQSPLFKIFKIWLRILWLK